MKAFPQILKVRCQLIDGGSVSGAQNHRHAFAGLV